MPLTLGVISSGYLEPLPPSLPVFTGQTILNLEGEGVDGAQNNSLLVNDESSFNRLFTVYGAPYAARCSVVSPIIGGIYLDGGSYYSVPASADFAFGAGDFTIEAWVNRGGSNFGSRLLTNRRTGQGSIGTWAINMSNTGFSLSHVITGEPSIGCSFTFQASTWYHIAVTRSSGTVRFFVDGNLINSGTFNTDFNNSAYPLWIGTSPTQTYLNGYISDIRVTRAALYTSNFARPTAPLTPTSNGGGGGTAPTSNQVVLLIKASLPAIIDSAERQSVIITAGNARISTAIKKNGNSSIYFDGAGDVLKIPHSNDFVFGSKDFMISTWIYPLNLTNLRTIFSKNANNTAGVIIFTNGTALRVYMTFNGSAWTVIDSTTPMVASTWQHLALYRQGSAFTLYLNNRIVGTRTDSRPIFDSVTASVAIGADANGTLNYSNGYIDDFVIMTNP